MFIYKYVVDAINAKGIVIKQHEVYADNEEEAIEYLSKNFNLKKEYLKVLGRIN